MYVCGPTVYKPSHVGHMVGPVIFDTIKRFLVHSGYKVKFVINITDIDDKLIAEAPRRNMSVTELASEVTADYKNCLAKLEVTGVDLFPKATDHIPEIIDMISDLLIRGLPIRLMVMFILTSARIRITASYATGIPSNWKLGPGLKFRHSRKTPAISLFGKNQSKVNPSGNRLGEMEGQAGISNVQP